MKKWKVIFWTGENHRTVFVKQKDVHFLVLCLERLITCNNWNLISFIQVY